MTQRPLSGIRILDLTRLTAGPMGIHILENLGAEIIKVENDGEIMEFSRLAAPTFGTTSANFLSMNSGKRDIAIDFNNEKHKTVLLKLAAQCDVVAENFRRDVVRKFQIDYEHMKEANPDIIYCSVSGFGQDGPYWKDGCADTIAQAMSGFMSVTGKEGEEPIRAGASVADVCASLYETIGILAALIWKEETGEGTFVDVPMLSTMMSISDGATTEYLNHGTKIRGIGNRERSGGLFQTFPASNGSVMIEATTEEHFNAFVNLLGLGWLAGEESCKDGEDLEKILFPITQKMTMTELANKCRSRGIPAGEVNTQESICRSGYLEQQQMLRWVHDSKEGTFRIPGLPMKFDKFEVPNENFVSQPGENSSSILKEILGMTEEEIAELYGKNG